MRNAVIQILSLITFTLVAADPASAQRRERGYVQLAGGTQVATRSVTDRFVYTVNAEDATTEARYPSKAGVLIDIGAGARFWRNIGAAIYLSRSSAGGTAHTSSQVPHPFADDRNRQVSGDAADLTRTETAAHAQVYYARTFGRWRVRAGAGPSYFHLAQEVVTGVTVNEEYPYDSAEFRSATTKRASRSSAGFNVGADMSRTLTRRVSVTALVRYTRGRIGFNVDATHRVSLDAGGAQAGAGLRVSF